ncbi:MAG TPA: GNAT family N-acetyltransferase [Planctomycetota bacterium]|nr:GNAT family N-acetyltransferase [Planctomycetota bacterium]
MKLRRALPSDLAYIHRLEHDPKNAPFITPWTTAMHRKAMKDRDCLHLIAENDGRRVGFVFLRGMKDREGSIEFKRIVIETKGKGHGRAALRLVQKLAFEKRGARCIWLDVKEFNTRAQELYRSEGFAKEGELRERVRRNGRYYSLIVMSKLRREYRP